MSDRNQQIDNYLRVGCGRCPLVGTPDCKVHRWTQELELLRNICLDCELVEQLKWSVPCYTWQDHNIAIVAAFKEYCSISFFKGALLTDPQRILEKPGENSQAARLIRFRSKAQVEQLESAVRQFLSEAVGIEKAGLSVAFDAKSNLEIPAELQVKFEVLPALKTAFAALTLGRQRGYILYFTAPKQSKTRTTRIEKCIPQILEGLGLHD